MKNNLSSYKYIKPLYSFSHWINNHWVIGFFLLLTYFSYITIGNLIKPDMSWNYIHLQIFTLTFLILLTSLVNIKINIMLILSVFILNEIFLFDEFLEPISSLFFQSTYFNFITNNIAVKDLNVFFLLCFMFLFILFSLKLGVHKYKYKHWDIYTIFSLFLIGAIIFITFIFHYILIENQFKPQIEEKLNQQEIVFKIEDKEDFYKICKLNRYICYENTQPQEILKNNPELSSSFSYFNSDKYIKGNFLINSRNNQIYLITAYNNKWVIDINSGSFIFKNNENLLLLGLSFAHGFWLIFYLWLNLFHRNLRNKRSKK